jgi:hypothetical protein
MGRRRLGDAADRNEYFLKLNEAAFPIFGTKEQAQRFGDYNDATSKQVATFLQQLDGWDWFYDED